MPSEDPTGAPSASPIVLRIKLRYDDVEAMVARFATNVGKSGLFLPTRALQPLGSEVKFELRLADDTPVLVGLGRIKAVTAPDPEHPRAAFGMAIELMRVTPQSRAVFLRMLERRRELGLPELGLPLAADIDAARRAQPAADDEPDPLSPPTAIPAPVAAPVIDVAPAELLLTAPRRAHSISVANVVAVAPLAPEPVRRKRTPVSEVIDSVSGPVAGAAAVPGLDDDVDVAAAIVRARALAGAGLDAELDRLAEEAAAPIEISIEAASAELARQLGGSAVRRDRSARWMTPPATTTATNPVVPAVAEPEPASDDGDVLDDLDLEDVEHTELGAFPDRGSGPSAIDEAMLAARLEAQLAEAEAEADDLDLDAGAPPHDLSLEEIDDFEILAEADASDESLLAAATDPERSGNHLRAAGASELAAASELDFAARLDLGDDSDPYLGLSAAEIARRRAGGGGRDSRSRVVDPRLDPHFDSAGHALAAFESDDSLGETAVRERVEATTGVQPIFELETSNSFTLAGVLTDSLDLDAPSSSIQPEPAAPEPAVLRARPAAPRHPRPAKPSPSLYDSPVEDHELEHALEALDVDLDDLSIPHADTHLQRGLGPSTTRQSPVIRPASATRKPASISRAPVGPAAAANRVVASRPPTDDGVAIEFEEEE